MIPGTCLSKPWLVTYSAAVALAFPAPCSYEYARKFGKPRPLELAARAKQRAKHGSLQVRAAGGGRTRGMVR